MMLSSSASVLACGNGCLVRPAGNLPKRIADFKKAPAQKRATRSPRVQTQSLFGGGGGAAGGPAYICKDCGYIEASFEAQPKDYRCPVCNAPKRRFALYKEPVAKNANSLATLKARKAELQGGGGAAGGDGGSGTNPALLLGAAVAVLAALYVGLNAAL